MTLQAVILAGGTGSRLWPLSRASKPKQFHQLHGDFSMLQATARRLSSLNLDLPIVTVCNEEHRFFVAEQLRQIDNLGPIILEPVGRNTAPAITLAALASGKDDLLLVLAADHVIQDEDAFIKAVLTALPLAEAGKLITFGIEPDEPMTGFGYIKKGAEQDGGFAVEAFIEKPSRQCAENYVNSGDYLWNSGMFLFKSGRFIAELSKYRPDIYRICSSCMDESGSDSDFIRIDQENFEKCSGESIDYAVMENTKDAVVVPMNVGWSDIGSWSSLWKISDKDALGNAVYGNVMLHQTENSYVRTDEKLVAAVGVNDLIIMSTKDVLLVASRAHTEEVKAIAQRVKSESRPEWENHREVYRPWGKFDAIDRGERYQVKRITVKPGAKLSVQKHNHRSEHWVVVAGTAKVTNGDETFFLHENESTYIPLGVVHALENPGSTPLEIIEIQSGSYLGEDDIIRFEDLYGRVVR